MNLEFAIIQFKYYWHESQSHKYIDIIPVLQQRKGRQRVSYLPSIILCVLDDIMIVDDWIFIRLFAVAVWDQPNTIQASKQCQQRRVYCPDICFCPIEWVIWILWNSEKFKSLPMISEILWNFWILNLLDLLWLTLQLTIIIPFVCFWIIWYFQCI